MVVIGLRVERARVFGARRPGAQGPAAARRPASRRKRAASGPRRRLARAKEDRRRLSESNTRAPSRDRSRTPWILVSISPHSLDTWPWRCRSCPSPARSHRPSGSTRPGSSLLDHRRQHLLGHPTRLQEAGEVAPLPQLRDLQLHRADPGLPDPVAVAVAAVDPVRRSLAGRSPGQPLDLT